MEHDVSLREYLERLLIEFERRLDERFTAQALALRLAETTKKAEGQIAWDAVKVIIGAAITWFILKYK